MRRRRIDLDMYVDTVHAGSTVIAVLCDTWYIPLAGLPWCGDTLAERGRRGCVEVGQWTELRVGVGAWEFGMP